MRDDLKQKNDFIKHSEKHNYARKPMPVTLEASRDFRKRTFTTFNHNLTSYGEAKSDIK